VTDENDEYPEFRREEYFSSIKEKSATDTSPVLLFMLNLNIDQEGLKKENYGMIRQNSNTIKP
jgi:hypothetical protein